MYNIVILAIALMLTPSRLRHDYFYAILEVITDSLQLIVDEFNEYRLQKQYEMSISSQIIYLEKFLNDRYNLLSFYPAIYITDSLVTDEKIFVGNADEEDAEVFIGDEFDTFYGNYMIGNEVIFGGKTWRSLINNNGDLPAEGLSWTAIAEDEIIFVGNADEYGSFFEFVVHISASHWEALTDVQTEMSLYINRYKLLGINYTYDIYEEV